MRIVSLLAGATEMIAALGCLDQHVGRSHECDYPPEVQRLPLVSMVQINTDASSAEIDAQIKQLASSKAEAQENVLRAGYTNTCSRRHTYVGTSPINISGR